MDCVVLVLIGPIMLFTYVCIEALHDQVNTFSQVNPNHVDDIYQRIPSNKSTPELTTL